MLTRDDLPQWLEKFVSEGTVTIHNVASALEQLIKDLAPLTSMTAVNAAAQTPDTNPDGTPGEVVQPSTTNLISDLREFLQGAKRRDEEAAELRSAMGTILQALTDDLKLNADARKTNSKLSLE